ncbi:inositol monophosphatase [Novosphingobium nitrogenifigens DSM 19370]|uniref:Inositol monophosphatase n=1 Tax=Novosphingobium nitrogenifigens DSM 19370 TaxID=983920 RepID=F1Z9R2_9SPHN|nr:inositol monophosphatase family protein [Novosphingobium nitrogenifigens]EGD58680.1 inositol monophosphatase [Novosphingobium nitrogenifigens DSM 19370]
MSQSLDRDIAALLADVAQNAILPRYQHLATGDIIAKAADDMVTVADTDAEARLSEALARLLPEAAIVGEEAAHADPAVLDRLGDSLCWIIDPLDGTNNFAAGKPPFGILLALAEKGETVSGWIYDVLSGRLCSAHRGQGAFVNGEPVRARTTGQEPPIAAISLVFLDGGRREAMKAHVAPHYTLVDIPRCAAEQYPRIALGVNDVSIFERTLAWDHAAGVLFVNEAGGKAARPDGGAYRVDRHLEPGLIAAASPALFDDMAARLAEL